MQMVGVAGVALLLAACGATPGTPERASQPGVNAVSTMAAPQTNSAGNVTVQVIPRQLKSGGPVIFEIVMDTHSVDLAGDMLALVELRDERGNALRPVAWDGTGGGGHHRAGMIRFDALPAGARTVSLVVKNIAGVTERVFAWDVPA